MPILFQPRKIYTLNVIGSYCKGEMISHGVGWFYIFIEQSHMLLQFVLYLIVQGYITTYMSCAFRDIY